MGTSRRDLLLQGCVIGGGVIATSVPGIVALAQTPQLPERRSLQGLAWNDPIVATYRDAVGQMKQKPATDKFSWVNLAKIHGTDPGHYHFCPHGNWYFLPWHRAFTVTYERIIRELTKNKDFALPYWDWTANPRMPDVFLQPKTPDGKTNWLYDPDAGFTRTWPPAKPMPAENVGPAVLAQILKAANYEEFGTSRPQRPKQNSLAPSWVLNRTGNQGVLEGNAHNNVHNNIGGWMPTASSPRDPIFFMHHSNIDRIWALWNAPPLNNPNSKDPLWTDMPFTDNFYNVDGSFWSPHVSDLYVPEKLGYTYGLPAAPGPAIAAAPSIMALSDKLTTLFATPDLSGAAGIKSFAAQNSKQATATSTKPLDLAVDVDPALVSAIAGRKPVSSGAELLNFQAAREQAASGTRALAFIRDVEVTRPETTMYRIFIDRDDLSPDTPISDPNYVGTFGIFFHGDHGGGHDAPSFVVDLTQAIQRVYAGAASPPKRIRLQVQPVPNTQNGTAGTARPSAVEVAFVSS
jgi:tyrosinase